MRGAATLRPHELITFVLEVRRGDLHPLALTIQVAPVADQKTGVRYGFVKLPEIDPSKRQPRELEFSAAFTRCDAQSCIARIENDPSIEGHDLEKDFVQNMLKYDATIFSFEIGGKDSGAGFTRQVLASDREGLLAESKKGSP